MPYDTLPPDLSSSLSSVALAKEEASAKEGRGADGRFAPGNPGRRHGSRNRISSRVVMAVLADFEAHQEEILGRLRQIRLPSYIRLISALLPRTLDLDTLDDWSEEELAQALQQARAAVPEADAETAPAQPCARRRRHRNNGD